MKINIITRMNGVGLQRDAEILKQLLPDAQIVEHGKAIPDADLHIFIEIAGSRVMKLKGKKILIPNPEWYFRYWTTRLKFFDAIFCKTRHAVEIFSKLHKRVVYCGFTSRDMMDEAIERVPARAHFPGKSKMKGTALIKKVDDLGTMFNYSFQDEAFHKKMMNTFSIHLCPSEAEGWGHYIWEAFSVGAYVITTDAPPMNEQEFVGAKVRATKFKDHGLSPTWKVSEKALVEAINSVTPELIESARWVNRALFLKNDGEFRTRFLQLLKSYGI